MTILFGCHTAVYKKNRPARRSVFFVAHAKFGLELTEIRGSWFVRFLMAGVPVSSKSGPILSEALSPYRMLDGLLRQCFGTPRGIFSDRTT